MSTHLRLFLAAAGALALSAAFQPALHAQGFGGMFSTFQMNGATDEDDEGVTTITASAADIDLANNIVTLIGDVVVDDNSSKITCNKMIIYLAEDAADTLVGTADKPGEAEEKKADKPAVQKEEKPQAVSADGTVQSDDDDDDEDDDKKNISRIVCSGDVVYLKRADPNDPKGEDQIAMSEQADYDLQKEVILMTGKPVMMQGSNKMYGDRIEILVSEGNRMRVINPKVYYTGQSLLTKPSTATDGSTRP